VKERTKTALAVAATIVGLCGFSVWYTFRETYGAGAVLAAGVAVLSAASARFAAPQQQYLSQLLRGHYAYYGMIGNARGLANFAITCDACGTSGSNAATACVG
jgi:hypothetical protein